MTLKMLFNGDEFALPPEVQEKLQGMKNLFGSFIHSINIY